MPVDIAIHDEKAQKALAGLMDKLKTVKDGGREFGMALSAVVFQDVIDHFEREEGPEGKWHPWSDMYKRLQDARGKGGNKLLQDSGRLRQTFLPTNFRKVGEGILWFNPAKTKSGFPYAWAHNEGVSLPKRQSSKITAKYGLADKKGRHNLSSVQVDLVDHGASNLPARTFMWTSDVASERIGEITLEFVLGK